MRIALITIYSESNFGNRLQNYAACRMLSDLGFDVETLVLKEPLSLRRRIRRSFGKGGACLLPKMAQRIAPQAVRAARFRMFTEAHIPTRYVSEELVRSGALASEYDLFAVGSDQVWNPTFYFFPRNFEMMLLNFVPPEKRFAISASFGVTTLPTEWRERFRNALSGYAALTVRETAGADLIRDLTGRTDATVVPDPTLMTDPSAWMHLARRPHGLPKRYVLDAFLGERQTDAGAGELPRIALSDPAIRACGPSEFLYLVLNAEAVYTDSYHACIFAILFGKPLTVYLRRDGNADMSSRMEELFRQFGLELNACVGNAVAISKEDRMRVAEEGKHTLGEKIAMLKRREDMR